MYRLWLWVGWSGLWSLLDFSGGYWQHTPHLWTNFLYLCEVLNYYKVRKLRILLQKYYNIFSSNVIFAKQHYVLNHHVKNHGEIIFTHTCGRPFRWYYTRKNWWGTLKTLRCFWYTPDGEHWKHLDVSDTPSLEMIANLRILFWR